MPVLRDDTYPTTLRKLIDQTLPPADILPLFSQIMDGVEAAHLLGVVHRDLKPENVLVDMQNKHPVVADFGIARFEEDLLITAVETRDAARMANFCYLAPEQRMRNAPVDQARRRKPVVAAPAPPLFEAIELMADAYWSVGNLTLRLNRTPEPGWVRLFHQDGNPFISDDGTTRLSIQGDRARIAAREQDAERIIEDFTRYIGSR